MARGRRTGDPGGLRRRLRREAAASRPAFSPALQTRIEAALSAERASRRRVPWTAGLTAVAGCVAAACLAAAVWLAGGRDPQPGADEAARVVTAALPEPVAIDQLPLWEELEGEVLAGTAALAAEAVGLPRWNDLVAAGAAFVGPGDDQSAPITP
jgi:hypothetical protein